MGKVPIRVPTGSPAQAFFSRPAPAVEHVAPAQLVVASPEPAIEPAAIDASEFVAASAGPAPTRSRPVMAAAQPQSPESQVRFQFYLPVGLAKLVDAEVDRRKALGRRGRGKSDYTTIFRELVAKHLS